MWFTAGLALLLVAVCQADSNSPAVYPQEFYRVATPVQPISNNRSHDVKQKRDSYIGGKLGGVVGGVTYPQQNHLDWPYYNNYQAAQVGPMAPVSPVLPIAVSGNQPVAATDYPGVDPEAVAARGYPTVARPVDPPYPIFAGYTNTQAGVREYGNGGYGYERD